MAPGSPLDPTNFVTYENWISDNRGFEGRWVENGTLMGSVAMHDHPTTFPQFTYFVGFMQFWADAWNGDNFQVHYVKNAEFNRPIDHGIISNGNGTWNMYVDGAYAGTTRPVGNDLSTPATGVESVWDDGHSKGVTSAMRFKRGGAWHGMPTGNGASGWGTAFQQDASTVQAWSNNGCGPLGSTTGAVSPQMFSLSAEENAEMTQTAKATEDRPVTLDDSRGAAMGLAVQFADPEGAWRVEFSQLTARAMQSTRAQIGRDLGYKVNDDRPILAYEISGGSFSARVASEANGGTSPSGSVLTVVADPTTKQILDWIVSRETSLISAKGYPIDLN